MAKKRKAQEEEEEEDELDDDFNGSEDGGEDLEDDVDVEEEKKGKKQKRRKGAEFFDDVAEEDDEEEEEDGGRKGKKRSVFIDDIADVDDDEEEEEIDDEAEDLIDDRDVELPDDAGPSAAPYRVLNRDREEKTEEELARYIEERYKQYEDRGEAAEDTSAGLVGQQGLLPTLNDPKLWMVHCRPGREREACIQLQQKFYTYHERGMPLLIRSVICLDHLKGYIYVEAEKEAHVKDAIRGLRTMFSSKGTRLVPLGEMVDAITVNRKAKEQLARDSWVRVKNGLYKDDLAKVVDTDYAAQRATILLLPRIDFVAMANRDEEQRRQNPFGRVGAVRPPAKPFNAEEARQAGLHAMRVPGNDGKTYIQVGTQKFLGGYTERTVAMKSLMMVDVPPLDELAKFNNAAAVSDPDAADTTNDLSSLMAALPQDKAGPKALFTKGDKVMIIKGELQNLEGVVIDINDLGKVLVKPKIEGFNEAVDFDPEELTKFFQVGDRIKVLSGQHSGETGMVVQVQDQLCIIISDTTKQEIKVFSRDLTEANSADTGIETLGDYQLHDLVQLDNNLAGLIVKIDKDAAKVLTTQSTTTDPHFAICRVTDIQRKLNTRNMLSTDQGQNQIRQGDYVTILEGRHKDKGGVVEHIWRGSLFIKAKEFLDQGGFMCIRARSTKVRGGTNNNAELANKLMQASPSNPLRSPAHPSMGSLRSPYPYAPQSPMHNAGYGPPPGAGGYGRPPPPRPVGGGPGAGQYSGRSNHSQSAYTMVGKAVRVVGGAYNGYRGRVKNETSTHVQLELDAITRVVTIIKTQVRVQDGAQPTASMGRQPGYAANSRPVDRWDGTEGGRSDYGYATRTPLHPSQTPLHPFGGATPAHPSMTPLHAPYTPMHAPTPGDDNYNMLQDPGHNMDRGHHLMSAPTPGLNAYTPAYTPAMTPSGYPDGPAPTPGDGGLPGTPGVAPTPGLAQTPYLPAQTPAITPADTAPTPGDHYGFTPAVGNTPGVANTPGLPALTPALTPGMAYTPATPGLDAMTPGLAPGDDISQWEGILVVLPSKKTAVVKSAGIDGRCTVHPGASDGAGFAPQGEEEVVEASLCTLVRPQKKDRIKVLRETHVRAGLLGTLIGVDNTDGIVKLEGTNDMQIIDLALLGKVVG